jgi:hypothetical protein
MTEILLAVVVVLAMFATSQRQGKSTTLTAFQNLHRVRVVVR